MITLFVHHSKTKRNHEQNPLYYEEFSKIKDEKDEQAAGP
jgi:hypothetical protein